MTATPHDPAAPDLSLVMPCYNEEEVVGYTIPQLVEAFEAAGHGLELVAVDNGSTDDTGKILQRLVDEGLPVVVHRIDVNEGYGNGILQGFPLARASWVGAIPADGQVDAEDVVKLFEALQQTRGPFLGKVRRRFRLDGLHRKLFSTCYNAFVVALWPGIGSIDINGSPKILRRDVLEAMQLTSRTWFLDPEIMIKAHYMGVKVLEMNVFSRMRGSGFSHVRTSTCWEFFTTLLKYRFSGLLRPWRKSIRGLRLANEIQD